MSLRRRSSQAVFTTTPKKKQHIRFYASKKYIKKAVVLFCIVALLILFFTKKKSLFHTNNTAKHIKSKHTLAVMVFSAREDFERRIALRETSYRFPYNQNVHFMVSRLFFVYVYVVVNQGSLSLPR